MGKNLRSKKIQMVITVKKLIDKGVPTREIMKQLGVSKQYISYWRHRAVKKSIIKKNKI